MKITFHKIKVRELINGYVDNDEEGVWGYGGKLNIRPKYQREFVYGEKDEQAVIDTVFKGFPLNVMYWVKNENDIFEVLDGQQRTISLCHYGAQNRFNVDVNGNKKAFANLTNDEREKFLNYELMIYICEGTDSEKIEWFEIINKQGVRLEQQELYNAVYAGSWLSDAKRHFSKTKCPASLLSEDYQHAKVIRQGLLELALKWISNGNVVTYMSAHQHDADANELWTYFQNVIRWVQITFPVKRPKIMKSVNWGELYNNYHNNSYNSNQLEEQISKLIKDKNEVTNQVGIYHYVLSGDETKLNLRQFEDDEKLAAYERQKGICIKCGEHFEYDEMEGDHIIPWSKGGKTTADNCQMLCKKCNATKSNK